MLSGLEAVLHEVQKTNMSAPTRIRTLIPQFPSLNQPQWRHTCRFLGINWNSAAETNRCDSGQPESCWLHAVGSHSCDSACCGVLAVLRGNVPSHLSGSKAKLNDTTSTFLPFPIFRRSVSIPRAVNIKRRAFSTTDWPQFLVLLSDGGRWQGAAGPLYMNESHFF